MIAGRRAFIAIVAGIAVVSLVVGFVVGSRIQSPEEAAAEAEAPEASAVTAVVELRELTSQVVTRGDAGFAGAVSVTVETGSLDMPAIVTGQVPDVGDTIEEGMPILEVVGRPVIALAGDLPMYRTLTPGSSGPDVQQLETALVRLGLDPGDADDGIHDDATSAAVDELYERAGYAPPQPPDEIQQEIDAAREAVEAAHDQFQGAQQALEDARTEVTESQRLSAEAQVAAAERALEQAESRRDQHAASRRAAEQELKEAEAELAAAQAQYEQAQEDDDAEAQAAAADERDAARDRVVAVEAELEDLDSQDQDGEVAAAEAQLEIARASRDELLAPPDVADQEAGVDQAREALETAQEALAEAKAEAGTPMPASELVFVPTLPRRVDEVEVERGSLVDGPVLTVSGADLVIDATVSVADAELMSEGMTAQLEGAGTTFDATVTTLRGAGDDVVDVILAPDDLDPSVAADLRGANLKITIPVGNTDGEVLVVPLAALTAGSDGGPRVEVQTDEGGSELVDVEIGLSADGYAEVEAPDGGLSEGDLVVVGQ